MYDYQATITRVIDGDTVEAVLDLGLDVHVLAKIRLFGINAPEIRGETRAAGLASRDWLAAQLDAVSGQCIMHTIKAKGGGDKRGKYGRLLGMILIEDVEAEQPAPRIDLNDLMVEAGLAVRASYQETEEGPESCHESST